ncbi:MAG: addiction module toxin [Rhodospirillaceae bacterium]|nr:MAG: addiction module toxin [Rhodospirillaceae bacterium]
MLEVRQTDLFKKWYQNLRDKKAAAAVTARINRLGFGLFGDVKPVGEGVSELRIKVGPGYRVYFVQRGKTVVILLCGGDKSTQSADIKKAKEIAPTV